MHAVRRLTALLAQHCDLACLAQKPAERAAGEQTEKRAA